MKIVYCKQTDCQYYNTNTKCEPETSVQGYNPKMLLDDDKFVRNLPGSFLNSVSLAWLHALVLVHAGYSSLFQVTILDHLAISTMSTRLGLGAHSAHTHWYSPKHEKTSHPFFERSIQRSTRWSMSTTSLALFLTPPRLLFDSPLFMEAGCLGLHANACVFNINEWLVPKNTNWDNPIKAFCSSLKNLVNGSNIL